MKKFDITILVNTCDKYEDAWLPFLRLLKIHWKSCPYQVVFITETKQVQCDFVNVKTITCGKKTWGKRLKTALESIETEYVLYFLEDFFLLQDVDEETFEFAAQMITDHKDIGYIGLKYNASYTTKDGGEANSEEKFWNKDDLQLMHRVNNMSALWRKDWFYKLVRTYESPWEFDNYATIRSKRYPYKVLLINNLVCKPVFDYGVEYKYGLGISGGKWLPKNRELFEKHGIEVDFEHLGWLDLDESYNQKTPIKSEKKKTVKVVLWRIKKGMIRFRSTVLPW